MLEAATKLADEAMIGFHIPNQLLFRGRERGSALSCADFAALNKAVILGD